MQYSQYKTQTNLTDNNNNKNNSNNNNKESLPTQDSH